MTSRWDLGGLLRPVEDENHQLWPLSHLIGSGGQGEVWLARGGRTAVKMITASSQQAAEAVHARLRRIQRLPLDGVPLAGLVALLRPPKLGYVMELADDMVALESLCIPDEEDVGAWYLRTGGLGRRLRLLAALADAMARLHSRGIVYQDLSPTNVLVSAAPEQHEIRLIDADNLSLVSQLDTAPVYTPGYGAPELVDRRSGATTLTDAHALAVLIFETLTTTHPFRGDAVLDADPDYQRDYADCFRLPWTDHPSDHSNACTTGLTPRRDLLSSRLWDLATTAFVDAVQDTRVRPTAARWSAALHAAAGQIVVCRDCGWGYRAIAPACPCGRPRESTLALRHGLTGPVGIEPVDPEAEPGTVIDAVALPEFTVLQPGVDTRLTARHALPAPEVPGEVLATVAWHGHDAFVRNLSGRSLWLDSNDNRPWREIRLGGQATAPVDGHGWTLHFGPRDTVHRWLRLFTIGANR